MAKKEYKVGETFQLGFFKIKVDTYKYGIDTCCSCFMSGLTSDCRVFKQIVGECIGRKREDKTDVIFVKVED